MALKTAGLFLNITINPLSNAQWSQPTISVTGTVSDSTQQVYVNGVAATVSNGVWEADNVPVVPDSGLAQLQVTTYPAGSDTPSSSFNQPVTLPPVVRLASFLQNYYFIYSQFFFCNVSNAGISFTHESWQYGVGGHAATDNGLFTIAPYAPPATVWQNIVGDYYDITYYGFVDACQEYVLLAFNFQTQCQLELAAGGPAQGNQLIRLTASAAGYSDPTDSDGAPGNLPLDPTQIQVLGQTLTPTATNASVGELYVSMPAGATQALPVTANGTQNLSFIAQAEAVSLRIFSGTNDVTGLTNTVIVGQQINLTCQLSISNQTVSNIQWTVPSYAISDYVIGFDSLGAYVDADFQTNRTNLLFYWVDGGNKQVGCTAQFQGQIVSSKAFFHVIEPTMDWIGNLSGAVSVDTNYVYSFLPNVIEMHDGGALQGDGSTNQGITFLVTNIDLSGYNKTNYSLFCVQLGKVQIENCRTNGTTRHTFANGLDTAYPTSSLNKALINGGAFTSDSPGISCGPSDNHVSDSNQFQMYLMFQANDVPSKPVPIKVIQWSWAGSADLNNSGNWILSVSNANISVNNQVTLVYPQWTNNIIYPYQFTNDICN